MVNTMNTVIKSQSGAVLVISLIMLLALTIIGITSTNVTGLQEKMAANSKESNLAFQAAEATLRYVETTQINSNLFTTVRSVADANLGTNTSGLGLYTSVKDCSSTDASSNTRTPDDTTLYNQTYRPFYNLVDWNATGTSVRYRTYSLGTGTNKKLKNIVKDPVYIIEEVNCTAIQNSSSSASLEAGKQQTQVIGQIITMRITAHAWGSSENAVATLQSTVKRTYK